MNSMNDLLAKFDAVEVKSVNLISEGDKLFCEKNQAAYEDAVTSYRELTGFWESMERRSAISSESQTESKTRSIFDICPKRAGRISMRMLSESILKKYIATTLTASWSISATAIALA